MNRKLLASLNLLGYLAVLVVNYLANALPLNNKTTGELSDAYPNEFVPAGITFSIWGVIYLLLGIFVVFQLIRAFKGDAEKGAFLDKIGPWFFLSSIFNASWIFAWHYEMPLFALLIMVGIFASLLMIYLKMNTGTATDEGKVRWMVKLPFSVYIGWISLALIANSTAVLVNLNWGGFGVSEGLWATIMIIVAAILGVAMLWTRGDLGYGLVILWGFLGIYIKQNAQPDPESTVILAAIAGGVLVLILGAISLFRIGIYGVKQRA